MRSGLVLLITAFITMLMLSLAVGPAAARTRVEARPSGAIRASASRLTFAGEVDMICDITLAGTINRLIAKTRGSPAGTLTSDTVNNCRSNFGSEATMDWLTPLAITYGSIEGTLPTIRALTLQIASAFLIRLNVLGVRVGCLYSGSMSGAGANPVRSLTIQPGAIPLSTDLRLGFRACPASWELAGSFTVLPTQTIALLER